MDPFLLPLRTTTKFHSQWTFLIPGFALLLEEGIALPGVHVDDGPGPWVQGSNQDLGCILCASKHTSNNGISYTIYIFNPVFFPTGKDFPKKDAVTVMGLDSITRFTANS